MAAVGCSKVLFLCLLLVGVTFFLCTLHWATSHHVRRVVIYHNASRVISLRVPYKDTRMLPTTPPPAAVRNNTFAPENRSDGTGGGAISERRQMVINRDDLQSLTLKPRRVSKWCSEQNINDFAKTLSTKKPLSLLIEPSNIDKYDDKNTFFVYVYSAPRNFWRRHTIRRTWGDPDVYRNGSTGFRVKVIFVLGVQTPERWWQDNDPMDLIHVARESCLYNDILMINLQDSYYNLTLKGLSAMYWIQNRLPRVKFIYKTDDDVMLNVFGWMRDARLMEMRNRTHSIRCLVLASSTPFREGKWAVTYDEFPEMIYPPFCSGTGYMLTGLAVRSILKATLRVPLFKLEDVYFTGLVAREALVSLQDAGFDTYWLFENDEKTLWPERDFRLVTAESFSMKRWEYFWQQVVLYEKSRPTARLALSRVRGTNSVRPSTTQDTLPQNSVPRDPSASSNRPSLELLAHDLHIKTAENQYAIARDLPIKTAVNQEAIARDLSIKIAESQDAIARDLPIKTIANQDGIVRGMQIKTARNQEAIARAQQIKAAAELDAIGKGLVNKSVAKPKYGPSITHI